MFILLDLHNMGLCGDFVIHPELALLCLTGLVTSCSPPVCLWGFSYLYPTHLLVDSFLFIQFNTALGQRAEVKGMGKAMFKGADGKMVGLKNVLWVPNLAANLISVWWLQKAGMDTSSKGAKTYTVRLGERILWEIHEDRDVYNEMWQIPVVPMPKERQVAASISTKGEAVGSGDGANGRAKEIESKKCNLGGTSKLGEHKEIGTAAQKQHKGEENPKAAAKEEYGESMWGTIASAAFSNPTSATGECNWFTLHRRMGHVVLPILQQLVKNEMVASIRVKGEPDEVLGCPTCMQAKFTRYPFSSSEAMAKAPLDEVVMDVVGPLKLGAAGAEYFLTILNVYTRMTWVYVLSKKSDMAETVKTDWLPMVERQQDRLVKAIHTDRGGEILSKEFGLWLKKNGIRHSLTMPYSPAMNGIAERANRTITETARGLLIEAGLPDYFWPDAVRSACVAKNRALTHVGADKWVPYVEWIGRKPKVDMLRVFGCMCMALVPKHLRHNKLGAKAIWAVHLGMAQNSKGWLLWDPFTNKFLVSKDCKFMENLMYKDWKAENEVKIGVRFGEVKSSGLEHVELPLELSSGSTTSRKSSLVNGGEEAKDAEEEEEEVQQVSERAPTLHSRTTSAPRIRVTPQQRQGLHVLAAEEEGRGKRRIQVPNRLTYDALGKPAKSALAGAALIVGDDEESDYEECAFAFFSPVEMPGEPATLKEALESSDAEEWKKAMESELKSIEENGTWEFVELPDGRKAITSKWLFKIKSDTDGKIERYKSRLVAKGYHQKEKVDYKELFTPVVKPTTLRTLLAGATIKGWVVKQMDVTIAFLNGILEEEIFMAQPKGFYDGSGRVWKLKKVLYGLKQAPRQWYLKLREVLEEIGFTPSSADNSLFMLGEGEQRSFMVVYVDDILIFSPSSDLVKECVKGPEEESVGEEERRRFHSLVGSLMYAAVNTRPDVAFATGQLTRVVQCPNEEQVATGMRVAKYLGQTPTVGLHYSAAAQRRQKGADGVEPGRLFLTAFSDASYASEPEDMTSVGGFIFCVGGGPTAWESKKQVDQTLSSVESKDMALFRAVREIVWQRHLLAELGEEQQGPTPLYFDSQGIAAAALGASACSTPPGTAPAEPLHTFTLDSGASRCFFRDTTTLTPLPVPVPVRLADPSWGPVVASSSTVLPCPVVLSGSLLGIHLPSFSTNLVSTAALQDAMVTTTTPAGQRVSICTCTRTGRHLATFTRRPGSSLYTLATGPPQHHRLGHPSLPCLRGMHSRFLGRERYFLLVVDDYTRYTTVFPLHSKGEVVDVLIPWIRTVRLQLHERFGTDLPVLRLHSDRGGEFSSDLLRDFFRGEGILQSFMLPASSQQNGIAERRIGLVMEVARTSMIHAAAPHFLWPFAVRYAAHQLNLWTRVSLPETSPTLRWTGKVGDASLFRVWGSRAFVRDTSADKLSVRSIPCVFLGFVPDAPGWKFYHPTSCRVLPSQDVTFVSDIYALAYLSRRVTFTARPGPVPDAAPTRPLSSDPVPDLPRPRPCPGPVAALSRTLLGPDPVPELPRLGPYSAPTCPGPVPAPTPSRPLGSAPAIAFDFWLDDLQLFLQCDSRDGLSLFDLTSGASTAPAADADSTVRSQWLTRDAAAFARYSSPAIAALSRLMLPYLFPDLAAFATVTDLITHLRTSDTRYRAALPAEFCAQNPLLPSHSTP
ncbi:unnamed protein product [Closterium sp. NIES-53]